MENAASITDKELFRILETAPDVYEDFSMCGVAILRDLGLVDEFLEFHEENPMATTSEIVTFIEEAADLHEL